MEISSLKNNCSLVVTKLLTKRPDQEILGAFLEKGWIPGKGCNNGDYIDIITSFGIEVVEIQTLKFRKKPTKYGTFTVPYYQCVTEFLATNRVFGTYILIHRGHVFLSHNGNIVDPNFRDKWCGKRKVLKAFHVKNPPEILEYRDKKYH